MILWLPPRTLKLKGQQSVDQLRNGCLLPSTLISLVSVRSLESLCCSALLTLESITHTDEQTNIPFSSEVKVSSGFFVCCIVSRERVTLVQWYLAIGPSYGTAYVPMARWAQVVSRSPVQRESAPGAVPRPPPGRGLPTPRLGISEGPY